MKKQILLGLLITVCLNAVSLSFLHADVERRSVCVIINDPQTANQIVHVSINTYDYLEGVTSVSDSVLTDGLGVGIVCLSGIPYQDGSIGGIVKDGAGRRVLVDYERVSSEVEYITLSDFIPAPFFPPVETPLSGTRPEMDPYFDF